MMMMLYDGFKEIIKIQKLRRVVSYTGFYCFVAVMSYAYTTNTWVNYSFTQVLNVYVLISTYVFWFFFSGGLLHWILLFWVSCFSNFFDGFIVMVFGLSICWVSCFCNCNSQNSIVGPWYFKLILVFCFLSEINLYILVLE